MNQEELNKHMNQEELNKWWIEGFTLVTIKEYLPTGVSEWQARIVKIHENTVTVSRAGAFGAVLTCDYVWSIEGKLTTADGNFFVEITQRWW